MSLWNRTKFADEHIRGRCEKFLQASLSGKLAYGDFEHEILRARVCDLELKVLRDARPQYPGPRPGQPDTFSGDVLQASLLCHLGHEGIALKTLGEQATEQGRKMRSVHILDIIRASVQQRQGHAPLDRMELLQAGFSTLDVSDLLSNVAGKILTDAYNAYPSVARLVSRRLPSSDFKPHKAVRLGANASFEEVAGAGEIKHGSATDVARPFQVKTYAKMFVLSRTDLIDDDMGGFDQFPRLLAAGAAQTLESTFWSLVMSNPSSFFNGSAGNFQSGVGSVLGVPGLTAALTLLRRQVDENGEPIAVQPRFLICPPELEVEANTLYRSLTVNTGGAATDTRVPNANSFYGMLEPQVVPHLSNSNYANFSLTGWYTASAPSDPACAFGLSFLNGVETPIIETSQADFSVLGLQMRGVLDFGVALLDPAGAVLSAGV